MSDIGNAVNKDIRVLLVRHEMTQKQLQEKTGIKASYFTTRINGKHEWTLDDLDVISRTFGLSGAAELLNDAAKEIPEQTVAA